MSKILQEIKVPLVSVNDLSLSVIEMNFSTGDLIKRGDIILVFESSKITYDVVSETDGYIQYLCELGDDYDVNELVALISETAPDLDKTLNEKAHERGKGTKELYRESDWTGKTIFSIGALMLMKENKISENVFAGRDFINKGDVETFIGRVSARDQEKTTLKNKSSMPGGQILSDSNKIIVEKLAANKKREIAYLSTVQADGLTSTINTFIETEGIFIHLNKALHALKNSLLPVTIYEASRLLKKYKELNAYYSDNAVSYYQEINIGFAIDLDKGLKVLKIANSSTKSIEQVEEDILDLSGRYLDDSLNQEDLNDVTFTITDLSAENVAFFRPLVNSMNSAILGMSSIDEKLNRCIFSITFDHRVTEGKLVARFLKELKERLESYQSSQLTNITCFKCFKSLDEDLSDVGFTNCITPKGESAFICQSCLKGF